MSKLILDDGLMRKLADMMRDTGLSELEYSDGDRKLRLSRGAPVAVAAPVYAPAPVAAAAPAAEAASIVAAPAGDAAHPGAVKSPMVGTAYLSPEPGKPVFVSVGDKVAAGQTLLIIEAMKTFNPIKAPKAGVLARIVVENAQPVEFGEVLMVIE